MATPEPPPAPLSSHSSAVLRRAGNAVVRRRRPWTPAVHELLRYLRDVGFSEVPEVLDDDPGGEERLG